MGSLSYEIPRDSGYNGSFLERLAGNLRDSLNFHDLSQILGITLLVCTAGSAWEYARLASNIGLLCLALSWFIPDQRKLREIQTRAGEGVRLSQVPASGVWTMDYNESTPYAAVPVQWARLLLVWALRDGAQQVRISICSHTMLAEYEIDNAWSEPTHIPLPHGYQIQSHLRRMAGLEGKDGNDGVIKLVMDGWFTTFSYHEELDGNETRLILTRLAPPEGSPQ